MIEISKAELARYSPELQSGVLKLAVRNKPTYIRIKREVLIALIEQHEPSLITKLRNAAKESVQQLKAVIRGEEIKAKEEEATNRLKQCALGPCPFFNKTQLTCRHSDCGCNLKWKTVLSVARCPIGRW